jgi:hypothetical protein
MSYQDRQKGSDTLIATHNTLVIPFSETHRDQIRACLDRSGTVTFSMREVEVSEFPQTLMQDDLVISD